MTNTILSVLQVLIALAMTGIILVQRGAGASAGAGFGAGASGTVFGSRGSGTFLSRSTAVLATAFFIVTFVMAILASRSVAPVEDFDLGVMGDEGVVTESGPALEVMDDELPQAGFDSELPVLQGDDEVPAGPVEPERDPQDG